MVAQQSSASLLATPPQLKFLGGFVDCPRPINVSILPHVVVANQALQENTKSEGLGSRLSQGSKLRCRVQVKVQSALSTMVSRATSQKGGGGGGMSPPQRLDLPPKKILQIN